MQIKRAKMEVLTDCHKNKQLDKCLCSLLCYFKTNRDRSEVNIRHGLWKTLKIGYKTHITTYIILSSVHSTSLCTKYHLVDKRSLESLDSVHIEVVSRTWRSRLSSNQSPKRWLLGTRTSPLASWTFSAVDMHNALHPTRWNRRTANFVCFPTRDAFQPKEIPALSWRFPRISVEQSAHLLYSSSLIMRSFLPSFFSLAWTSPLVWPRDLPSEAWRRKRSERTPSSTLYATEVSPSPLSQWIPSKSSVSGYPYLVHEPSLQIVLSWKTRWFNFSLSLQECRQAVTMVISPRFFHPECNARAHLLTGAVDNQNIQQLLPEFTWNVVQVAQEKTSHARRSAFFRLYSWKTENSQNKWKIGAESCP